MKWTIYKFKKKHITSQGFKTKIDLDQLTACNESLLNLVAIVLPSDLEL